MADKWPHLAPTHSESYYDPHHTSGMASPQSLDAVLPTDIQRDKIHYHAEGDVIIRVEHTLFKVYKAFLTHNSSVFATMFNLPAGMGDPEGSSDDHPIVLEGEKAMDFRTVLEFLYATPVKLQIYSTAIPALLNIISLAKFSHKYEMDHWMEWVAIRKNLPLNSLIKFLVVKIF
ncbi:hypothetical protein MSAN_02283200 [Mycena sanguinolenta]|uniref:BTB domain-containing protein n=1 Tax=Mycena sanguinolenta TaxID=230812 RepID=A0A8H6X8Q1_9AGAR|nr:hypothetical protein MSAN_02283200 [Mycena sanguinolenta]